MLAVLALSLCAALLPGGVQGQEMELARCGNWNWTDHSWSGCKWYGADGVLVKTGECEDCKYLSIDMMYHHEITVHSITNETFSGMPELEDLNWRIDDYGRTAGRNGLSQLPEGVFEAFPKLKYLSLEGHPLLGVAPEAFANNTALEWLDFGWSHALGCLPAGGIPDTATIYGLPRCPGNCAANTIYNATDMSCVACPAGSRPAARGTAGGTSCVPEAWGSAVFTLLVRCGSCIFWLMLETMTLRRTGSCAHDCVGDMGCGHICWGRIWLAEKGIKHIGEGAFSDLPLVGEVQLSDNELETLPEGLFRDMTMLRSLSLSGNKLKTLPESLLLDLPGLQMLSAGRQSVLGLAPTTFDYHNTSLGYLDLEDTPLGCVAINGVRLQSEAPSCNDVGALSIGTEEECETAGMAVNPPGISATFRGLLTDCEHRCDLYKSASVGCNVMHDGTSIYVKTSGDDKPCGYRGWNWGACVCKIVDGDTASVSYFHYKPLKVALPRCPSDCAINTVYDASSGSCVDCPSGMKPASPPGTMGGNGLKMCVPSDWDATWLESCGGCAFWLVAPHNVLSRTGNCSEDCTGSGSRKNMELSGRGIMSVAPGTFNDLTGGLKNIYLVGNPLGCAPGVPESVSVDSNTWPITPRCPANCTVGTFFVQPSNACPTAGDGICDEPAWCEEGTDCDDCQDVLGYATCDGSAGVCLPCPDGLNTTGVGGYGAGSCVDPDGIEISPSSSTLVAPTVLPTTPLPFTTTPSPPAPIIICEGDTKAFTINGIDLCVPPKLYPADNVSHCIFDKTWEDVQANRYIFQTGGLGRKMRGDEWKVWVCGAQLPCALEAHDWVCFTYNEFHDVFLPLGYNRELLIVRKC